MKRRSFLVASGGMLFAGKLFAQASLPVAPKYQKWVWVNIEHVDGIIRTTKYDPDSSQEMLHYCNWYRTQRGLSALSIDPALQVRCVEWAKFMASRGKNGGDHFYHSNDNVRENIAKGQVDPADAYKTWMNSNGHRANILSRVTLTGLACFGNYYVQQFK